MAPSPQHPETSKAASSIDSSDSTDSTDNTGSIDPDEVAKFSAMAAEWWDPNGKFRPLHQFNPVRLRFIRDTVTAHFGRTEKPGTILRKPLEGLRFLDIGCGGGLLSEPMCRLGATMVSVDAAQANIKTAKIHAQEQGLIIDYRNGTAESLLPENSEKFDVVLNMEVIEHTANPAIFLHSCAALLKPGGLMIIATINRTPKARLLAITMAERVLKWLPRGTHAYDKLVKPQEIRAPLEQAGMQVSGPQGVSYNPLNGIWRLSRDSNVNYMMVAKKSG